MQLTINRHTLAFDAPGSDLRSDDHLLAVLHEHGLTAAKLGCAMGQCGACAVIVDGRVATSCDLPLGSLEGQSVLTLEGLRESDRPLFDALVRAFEDEQAAQCGYCSAGILMRAAHWLRSTPVADALARGQLPQAQAVDALLEPHLCRCGSQLRIRRAVLRCAATLAGTTERAGTTQRLEATEREDAPRRSDEPNPLAGRA